MTFLREGEIAVVLQVDCAACTGSVVVTAPGRMGPFGDVAAPASISHLLDVSKNSPPEQSVSIRADGPWTATLLSWNDLDPNPLAFGDSVAFTEVVDLTLPGVLAIATDGTWSLSLVG